MILRVTVTARALICSCKFRCHRLQGTVYLSPLWPPVPFACLSGTSYVQIKTSCLSLRDQLRDHQFQLGDTEVQRCFTQWQQRAQILVSGGRRPILEVGGIGLLWGLGRATAYTWGGWHRPSLGSNGLAGGDGPHFRWVASASSGERWAGGGDGPHFRWVAGGEESSYG